MQKIKLENSSKHVIVDSDFYPKAKNYKLYTNGSFVYRHFKYRQIMLNREVLGLGRISGKHTLVQHKNKNILDCRKSNLLSISPSFRNHLKNHVSSSGSPYKGVCKVKGRSLFKAQIGKDGVVYYLGYFKNPKEAAKAYNKKAKELYGKNAFQNVVED